MNSAVSRAGAITVLKSSPAGQNQSSRGCSEYVSALPEYTLTNATTEKPSSTTISMPSSPY